MLQKVLGLVVVCFSTNIMINDLKAILDNIDNIDNIEEIKESEL